MPHQAFEVTFFLPGPIIPSWPFVVLIRYKWMCLHTVHILELLHDNYTTHGFTVISQNSCMIDENLIHGSNEMHYQLSEQNSMVMKL